MTEHEIEVLLIGAKRQEQLDSSKELIKAHYTNKGTSIELSVIDGNTCFKEYEVVQRTTDKVTDRFVSKDYEECSQLFDKLMNFKENV